MFFNTCFTNRNKSKKVERRRNTVQKLRNISRKIKNALFMWEAVFSCFIYLVVTEIGAADQKQKSVVTNSFLKIMRYCYICVTFI